MPLMKPRGNSEVPGDVGVVAARCRVTLPSVSIARVVAMELVFLRFYREAEFEAHFGAAPNPMFTFRVSGDAGQVDFSAVAA